jgi:hypothetical protein
MLRIPVAHCRVNPMHRNRRILSPLLASLMLLPACTTVKSHWPFGKAPQSAAQPVRDLDVGVSADAAVPVVLQYRERNALVVDLQGVGSTGQVTLTRHEGDTWPVRIAFRMAPTRFEVLEVRGAQRILLAVAVGVNSTTAELPAGIYNNDTPALTISWGPKSAF